MSNAEGREEDPDRKGFQALEGAVTRTLAELKRLHRRAAELEGRSAELEVLLKSFEDGDETAAGMKERLTRLEGRTGTSAHASGEAGKPWSVCWRESPSWRTRSDRPRPHGLRHGSDRG